MRKKLTTFAAALFVALGAWAATPCPPALLTQVPKVAQLRGLDGRWQPRCELLAAASLKDRLATKLTDELPLPPKLYLEVLQRLGFVPATPELYQRLLDFYASQVLGFYEPSRDTMVVVDRPLPSEEESSVVWVHELAHAAQEARFRLPTKLLGVKDNSDQQRSLSAIAEGEAMLVMLLLESPSPPPMESLEHAAQALVESNKFLARSANIGDFFVEDLAFPYAQGLRTVLSAYKKGGWPAVDSLLAHPPACTAQLLFGSPCNHLANRALPATPQGFQELLTDSLGAWAVKFWFSQVAQGKEAETLAKVWDGDRLRLIRDARSPQRWALCWKLRLKSHVEASWAQAFVRQHAPKLLTSFRKGSPPQVTVVPEGRTLTVWVDWPTPRP
ncbi:MAG: hypothetical protein ACK42L_01580 [Thermoanaerobaculum sp.]